MLDRLIDSPPLLAGAIAAVAVINYAISLSIVRQYARQHFVDYRRPPEVAGKAPSDAAQLATAFLLPAVAIVLTLLLGRFGRELVGGGVLVMQVAMLGSSVTDLLAVRSLGRSDAAEGQLRYSHGYRYRAGAARAIGAALVAGLVAVLFNSRSFLMGAIFLLAAGAGWYRRARQATGT